MSYPRIEELPAVSAEHVAWCTWCRHPGVISIAGWFGDGADHELCRNCDGLGTVRREKPLREESAWVFQCHNPRAQLTPLSIEQAAAGMIWKVGGNMRTRRIQLLLSRSGARDWEDRLDPDSEELVHGRRDSVLRELQRLDVRRVEVFETTGKREVYKHHETLSRTRDTDFEEEPPWVTATWRRGGAARRAA